MIDADVVAVREALSAIPRGDIVVADVEDALDRISKILRSYRVVCDLLDAEQKRRTIAENRVFALRGALREIIDCSPPVIEIARSALGIRSE